MIGGGGIVKKYEILNNHETTPFYLGSGELVRSSSNTQDCQFKKSCSFNWNEKKVIFQNISKCEDYI